VAVNTPHAPIPTIVAPFTTVYKAFDFACRTSENYPDVSLSAMRIVWIDDHNQVQETSP
jgi:hypothetical protein